MSNTISGAQGVVNIEQDKDAKRAYAFDLSDILPPGDPIVSVSWAPASGITAYDQDHDEKNIVIWFSGGAPKSWYTSVATYETASGVRDQFVVRLYVREDAELLNDLGSALFPNKYAAVGQMRRDRLMLLAANNFPSTELDNSYIWEKLRAAEREVARALRVELEPTAFFPEPPTEEQITALNGMPWKEDDGYDYDPAMYTGDRWGFIQTHSLPIVSVEKVEFAYPAAGAKFDIPQEWLQVNKKYGQVQIVPASTASVGMGAYFMQLVSSGRVIPNMIRVTYVAGLVDAAHNYPDLVDAVKKTAVLKMLEDAFMPQSGSISADGLSQSLSMDMSKYEDSIDRILNGASGSNGGLKAAIHGIRLAVM